jgi:prevent-host-death family protein
MPTIISSTKLRNEYNEVSRSCHEQMDPIFVTKNGEGDLAVMSIEAYETLARRSELIAALARGRKDAEAGHTMSSSEAISKLRSEFAR